MMTITKLPLSWSPWRSVKKLGGTISCGGGGGSRIKAEGSDTKFKGLCRSVPRVSIVFVSNSLNAKAKAYVSNQAFASN